MKNYSALELGEIGNIVNRKYGKAFLHDGLNLTSCEISINCLPGKSKLPFKHSHKQNEEVYIFFKGKGIFEVDGEQINIQEGTAIKVSHIYD